MTKIIKKDTKTKKEEVKEIGQETGDRNAKGRFVKGNSFASSSGYKWRKTRLMETLTEETIFDTIQSFKTILTEGRQAVKGDPEFILFVMKRILPEMGQKSFIKFPIGPTKTIEDLNNAHSNIIKGVEEDELDPKDAKDIQELLMNKHKLIESTDIQQQMEQLMIKYNG